MKMQYLLSQKMKEVVGRAEQAARDNRHQKVEPEHLLLGLVHLAEGEGGNFNLLHALNVSYITIIDALERRIRPGLNDAGLAPLSLSERADEILEQAKRYATRQKIWPSHLYLVLEETPGTLAYDVLHNLDGHAGDAFDFEGDSWRNGEGSENEHK